jgi:hypothetical protein
MICASILFVAGGAALVYGVRVLAGRAPLPWSFLVPKSPITPPTPQPQETSIAVVLSFTIATITILGGIGLFLVSLL